MFRVQRSQGGVTWIELLVIIAIIAIPTGLLLPSAQQVREAAARSTCQCNLTQLDLASMSYEGSSGKQPMVCHGQNSSMTVVLRESSHGLSNPR